MIGAPAAGEGSLRYSHTQIGWWMLGILGVSAVVALAAIRAAAVRAGGVPPVLVGGVLVILVVAIGLFSSLNVRVTEQSVVW
ncbi:MAG TPA: hypothetical protein VHM30_12435, partial [Gemmatimonadaceae bacterium]|nr:hypothetical protein [Gemmatimonadaceae bacterium]